MATTTTIRKEALLHSYGEKLLVFIWLRQYLKLHLFAYIFGISKNTAAEEKYDVVPILLIIYRHEIKWHSIRQWQQFLNTFPSFPSAEGMIHVTIHRIRRSSGPPQAEFYCGDKRCHVMSSRVIVDADGLMVTGDSIRPLPCTIL